MNLGHAPEAEDLADLVAIGQVLWGGHRRFSSCVSSRRASVLVVRQFSSCSSCVGGQRNRGSFGDEPMFVPALPTRGVGVQFWGVAGADWVTVVSGAGCR